MIFMILETTHGVLSDFGWNYNAFDCFLFSSNVLEDLKYNTIYLIFLYHAINLKYRERERGMRI